MKLIVQIPCFNEEATLAQTIADIPRTIPGIDIVEILVINDGSSDQTANIATNSGADHVISHTRNRGLAATFATGLMESLRLGADIIVNTDGDNQYPGEKIVDLINPILTDSAEIVIGDRQPGIQEHFSRHKRWLQQLGSWIVRKLSGIDVPDAVSGFRALSREAAIQINIVSSFSYTIEMLIQAGEKRIAVTSVVTGARATERESRLFRSIPQFVAQSGLTALRVYTMYRPLRAFSQLGATVAIIGSAPILRFLIFYLQGESQGHVQSLVIGSVLMAIGCFVVLAGVLADLIRFNRKLLEQIVVHERRRDLESFKKHMVDTESKIVELGQSQNTPQ